MTEDAFLGDRTTTKPTMWNGFRCNRGVPLFLIIYVITFSGITHYLERSRLQGAIETMNDIKALVSEQASIVAQMQMLVHQTVCSPDEKKRGDKEDGGRPFIFAITPTFARPVQKAELTRLSQTFLHVPNFHWIVVEDAVTRTSLVKNFLKESGLIYTHLNALTPSNYKLGRNDPHWKKPRGVEQRNAALRWIRENLNDSYKGVVYFADDDNTYSVKLFREMEKIKRVGVWPVGLVGGLMVEKPICDNATNKVMGFDVAWKPDRKFPVDMAGFAVNLRVILEKKDAWFSYETLGGFQETEMLEQLVTKDELEPLADACTKVYVWHTRTELPKLEAEQHLIKKGRRSNANIEV